MGLCWYKKADTLSMSWWLLKRAKIFQNVIQRKIRSSFSAIFDTLRFRLPSFEQWLSCTWRSALFHSWIVDSLVIGKMKSRFFERNGKKQLFINVKTQHCMFWENILQELNFTRLSTHHSSECALFYKFYNLYTQYFSQIRIWKMSCNSG